MSGAVDSSEPTAERLLQRVDALRGLRCPQCEQSLCGHELLFNIASGTQRPLCACCLARTMGTTPSDLRDQLFSHFQRRDCYGEVWELESLREGYPAGEMPACLWPHDEPASLELRAAPQAFVPDAANVPAAALVADDVWDAGDLSCGELILTLRLRMIGLPPRAVLKLISRDVGAKEDIPAWCRLTRHRLVLGQHPVYWIQRKD
jgi:tRNA 2-thiouridine synthesizing protein A